MQTVALLLVSTGVVDGVNIHIVGKNTCACPVVSFKHDGVVLVANGLTIEHGWVTGVMIEASLPHQDEVIGLDASFETPL